MDVVAGEEGGDGYADTCESGADYDDLHKLAVIVIYFFFLDILTSSRLDSCRDCFCAMGMLIVAYDLWCKIVKVRCCAIYDYRL